MLILKTALLSTNYQYYCKFWLTIQKTTAVVLGQSILLIVQLHDKTEKARPVTRQIYNSIMDSSAKSSLVYTQLKKRC